MNGKGISIIIPTHNQGRFTEETVESVLQQPSRYPFEIIVVDDASTDPESIQVLERVEQLNNVQLVRLDQQQGVQHARSTGLRLAKYDFILTIDGDDRLNLEEAILRRGTYTDRAIDILAANEDVAFVHGTALMFGGYCGLTISAYPVTEELILKKHHAQTTIIYRREDGINAGLYNEQIAKWQDWSFAVALMNSRYIKGRDNKVTFFPESYYMYRIHSNPGRISSKEITEMDMVKLTFRLYPEIFVKHYPDIKLEDIPAAVLSNKPDRLTDLLFVANYDIEMARRIISERGYGLVPTRIPNTVLIP